MSKLMHNRTSWIFFLFNILAFMYVGPPT